MRKATTKSFSNAKVSKIRNKATPYSFPEFLPFFSLFASWENFDNSILQPTFLTLKALSLSPANPFWRARKRNKKVKPASQAGQATPTLFLLLPQFPFPIRPPQIRRPHSPAPRRSGIRRRRIPRRPRRLGTRVIPPPSRQVGAPAEVAAPRRRRRGLRPRRRFIRAATRGRESRRDG